MPKIIFKSMCPVVVSLVLAVSIALSAAASEKESSYDSVELKDGKKLTGTFLNDTLTVTTAYTVIPLEKDKISEIMINPENKNHDVIVLIEGGLLEGTIEEPAFAFKLESGETVSVEKVQCQKIILKSKNE